MKNYYEILGVAREATAEEIKKAYIRLCKKYHPDISSLPKDIAESKMKEITEAYAVLSDPTKRAAYDANTLKPEDVETFEDMSWSDFLRHPLVFKIIAGFALLFLTSLIFKDRKRY